MDILRRENKAIYIGLLAIIATLLLLDYLPAVRVVTSYITPPVVLFLGLAYAVLCGQAYPKFNKTASKKLLQYAVVGLGFGMNLHQSLASGKEGMIFTIASVAGTMIIGMLIGSIAGYCGGKIDLIIMRIVDVIYSLPDMLMVILLASVMGTVLGPIIDGTALAKLGSNMISLFIVFALLYWVSMARLIRGQMLSLREQEYVLSARASGAKSPWIIRKHLIPNCISVIIISTALQIPSAIFTESYLSFLGLGVNAPMPSLGSLASDALNGFRSYPERLIIPAIVISLIVLSLNLFGDGLRDAFDPKLNN